MSLEGIESLPSNTGSQYDFTKMTNRQLYEAAKTLQSEGKISVNEMATMLWVAQGENRIPVNGAPSLGLEALDREGTTDFLSEFQEFYQQMENTPGTVGADLYKSIADEMTLLDGTPSGSGLSTSV